MSYNGYPLQPRLYRQESQEFVQLPVQYPAPLPSYSPSGERYADTAAGEPRPAFYPSSTSHIHPYPVFTRHGLASADGVSSQSHSLEPHILSSNHQVDQSTSPFPNISPQQQHHSSLESPQSWPLYDQSAPFPQTSMPPTYPPFPSPSPFPPARLSPPPLHHQTFHFRSMTPNNTPTTSNHRLTLAGSLDPATGIFYRTPEHPRLRTAQACEKCRTRKAKCSGEHPTCKRCITRGLVCEYAKEGRVRGPNKPKPKVASAIAAGNEASSTKNVSNSNTGRNGARHRTSSSNSSAGSSSDHPSLPPTSQNLSEASDRELAPARVFGKHSQGSSRRNSLSLGEHRVSSHRPPDLQLEAVSNLFRLSNSNSTRSSMEHQGDSSFTPYTHEHHGSHPFQFQHDDLQQHHQVELQKNAATRLHGHLDLHLSSSVSSLKRIPQNDHHSQSGQFSTLSTPPSCGLVPAGKSSGLSTPVNNINVVGEQELLYPPASYFDDTSESLGSQHQRNDSSDSFSSSFMATNNTTCYSPYTSASAGTTSTMGSPLTPASTSILSTQQKSSYSHSSHRLVEQPSGLDTHFDLDTASTAPLGALGIPHVEEQLTPEIKIPQPIHPSIMIHEQDDHRTYHPAMNMPM